jgi:hypothetical protein
MPWTRQLPAPLVLNDGQTLSDARALILALPARHQRNEHWQYAAALLLEAATSRGALKEVAAQFERALRAEGLLR